MSEAQGAGNGIGPQRMKRGQDEQSGDAFGPWMREPIPVHLAAGLGGGLLCERLCWDAPGTFLHALRIADFLADLFPGPEHRVACLLHDCGKLANPQAFAENVSSESERPPGSVIRAHVTDGLALADKHSLPPLVRRAIAEHHGTLPIDPQAGLAYPGPKPGSPFTATLMIADFLEAISAREALDEALAWKVLESRLQTGQFSDSGLDEEQLRERFTLLLQRALMRQMTAEERAWLQRAHRRARRPRAF